MRAMVLERPRTPLVMRERSVPEPGSGELLIEVTACGVCRTDLHVADGELPNPKLPIVPGHEIVGRVAAMGAGVAGLAIGERVGVPWLGSTCGLCPIAASVERICAIGRCLPAIRAMAATPRARSPTHAIASPFRSGGMTPKLRRSYAPS